MNTRSNLDLHIIPISQLQYTSSCRQPKNTSVSSFNSIIAMADAQSTVESNADNKLQDIDSFHVSLKNLDMLREYENQRLSVIKMLTMEEMMNIAQWLLSLYNIYEELRYPLLSRVSNVIRYFQEEEQIWFQHTQSEINNDWSCFCMKLKQHIHHRLQSYNVNSLTDKSISFVSEPNQLKQLINGNFIKYDGKDDAKRWLLATINKFKDYQLPESDQLQSIPLLLEDKALLWYKENEKLIISIEKFRELFLQQFTIINPNPDTINLLLASELSITMTRELIRTPIYFSGLKDDVFDWLEKIERRFRMANWDDDNKLRYISIHLQDDAYKWWIQASKKILTWPDFVKDITQAFTSAKMKELAFEQLRWYKQSVNQTITQYYDQILELCTRIDPDMPDSLKLQYLIAGVKESLKLHIALHDPQTSESFFTYARKLEATLSFTNSIYDNNQTKDHHDAAAMQQFPSSFNNYSQQYKNKQKDYVQRSRTPTYQSFRNYIPFNTKHTHTNQPQYESSKSKEASVDGVASNILYNNPSIYNTSLLYLTTLVNNQTTKVMIDTGANRTFISVKALSFTNSKQFINTSQRRVFLADGQTSIIVYGEVKLHIMLGDIQASIVALIVKQLCTDCILGMDFINKYKLIINTEDRTVSICENAKRTSLKIDSNPYRARFPTRLINNIRIPPKHTISIPVSINLPSAKVLFRPSFKLQQRIPLVMLGSLLTVRNYTSFISLYNPTASYCSLPKGIILGTTTIPTSSFQKLSHIDQQLADIHIHKLIQHISNPEQQEQVKFILFQHAKLFDTSKPTIAFTLKPHEIKTLDHPPPTSKPYYSTPLKQEAMYKIIQELLHFGLIRPSYSPYAAPALLVAKHDGSWRMVVDYKKLNNITIKDNHPLPNMEQAIQVLGGGYNFFSKLDMKSGFWQIPIKQEDKYKTAFITPDGLYEWNVLAQGLKNSPPSFQRVMTDILSPCRQFSLVYIDDIIIYSRSFEEHLAHMTQILSILLKHNFQLNPSKCSIFQHQIDYLSHTISEHSVKPTDEKIQGGLSWYRKFIPQFATIAASIHKITNLTKPNKKKFIWGDSQKQAFLQLKHLLVTSPLFLDFPNHKYPIILTTDASKVGIGGTLQQIIDGETKNLYYHSQVTSSTQRRYDPIELEALAIWLCFQRMRSYLLGRSIIIYTDHCPLCNMMNSSVKNRRVDRISILLQEYNIEKIIHIKGQHNCLADYLSRHPIQHHEEIFDADYGIKMLFDVEPPSTVSVPDTKPPVINAVVTRSKRKQMLQQQVVSSHTLPINPSKKTFSDIQPTNIEPSTSFTCPYFDIERIKEEQTKDPNIQRKIKELQA
ncbi:unnamed protein product [Rotaria sp. Silwood2]|nr:unnamed protein product [Rotaria sp. Silwood2]